MANTIKLKRGTSTPSTSDIVSGEVAVDTSAKKLYINDSGTVKEIGGGGGGVTSDQYQNTIGGTDAGSGLVASSDGFNTFFGYKAGEDYNGTRTTAIGNEALKTNYNLSLIHI